MTLFLAYSGLSKATYIGLNFEKKVQLLVDLVVILLRLILPQHIFKLFQ